ncbi:C40 family peptidase [Streptomyces millisiae]|uniref:NlpC/P60 family protein n=1 Tax=Streptomyces millisiae TaxID=3075542 RepID=A0ABU2M1A1_9ACTN|nr:NlpC/P60 family protein [Streptomyces sp. DSM 44918]MDT0323636.1 NlpC/P60 family protein [Streptomyces sp. DSM 44918]
MASHRRPKQPSRARVTFFGAAATAAATVGMTAQSASADPGSTKEEVQEEVDRLYEEAEAITEEYNGAREREEELESEIEELQDSAARGQEELNELRANLGAVATAQYRTGGIDPSVQLFLASDPDAYLDQASRLSQVSGRQAETLRLIENVQRDLDQRRDEATDRLAELEEVRSDLSEQKDEIQGRLSEAQALLNQLTEEERAALAAEEAARQAEAQERANRDSGRTVITDGTSSSYGAAALNAAASKVGSPYVWGATGPNSFDCSGLTSWAYAQAGVSLPRTSQSQATIGTRLSMNELAPGDLVFYYDDLHHVGLYAGNGQIVHAANPADGVEYLGVDVMPFMFGVRVG